MADLENLMNELHEQQVPEEESQEPDQEEPEEEESVDREIIDLPPALAQAAKGQQPTNDEDDRLDLQDFAVRGSLHDQVLYSQLQNWWVQELQAPELLPWNNEVVPPLMEAVFGEEDEMMTATNNLEAIVNDIRRVDKERVQFTLANLLQARLHKIQSWPWFHLGQKDRLSEEENLFLADFHKLLENHLQTTVTDHFPQDAWSRLDEPEMIEQPNLDQYVMVQVLKDITLRKGTDEARPLEEGSKCITIYDEIRDLVAAGAVQLIM